jgi:hypothetical protein
LLVDGECAPGDGEVVIGGKQGDQAEGKAADGLGETEAIETGPRRGCCWQFCRNRRLLAAGWRSGGAGGRGHGAGAETGGEGSFHRCHRCHNTACKDLGKGSTRLLVPTPVAVGQICSSGLPPDGGCKSPQPGAMRLGMMTAVRSWPYRLRIHQLISSQRAMTADNALRLEQWLSVEAAFLDEPAEQVRA